MNHEKPVTFVAGGTRGDVQPYVVLARAMRDQGIHAQVAASLRWRTLVESMGVAYRPLPADPVELLLQPRFRGALTLSHGVGTGMRSTWQYLRAMRPYVAAYVDEVPRVHNSSRAIVAGIASQWIAHPTIGASTPFIWGLFQPVAPTRDFVSPLVHVQLPQQLNRLSHVFVNRMMWLSWQLHGFGAGGGLTNIVQQPAFFAFSQQLVPPWSDISAKHAITGWLGGVDSHPPPSMALQTFLEHPAPFVMATFGTPAENESTTPYETVIQACQHHGVRLLIQAPKHLVGMPVPDGVLVIGDDVNHQQLFARSSVVIHHGGAGTTHACLAAGVPMIIVPRGIDQFYWASRVHQAQLTPTLLSHTGCSVNVLCDALTQIDVDVGYRARMRAMQQGELVAEGIDHAIQFIQRWL